MTTTPGRSPRSRAAPPPSTDASLVQVHGRIRELELLQRAAETFIEVADPTALPRVVAGAVGDAMDARGVRVMRRVDGEMSSVAEWGARGEAGGGEIRATMTAGEERIGLLLVTPLAGTRFTAADAHLLERIANLAGHALAAADRLLEERDRADRNAEMGEAKGQFLNLASHELRGPMTVIMGYLSLLEDGAFGPLPDEFSALFPVVNARLAEMEALINAMLETSRLEENRLELNVERMDLREVVDDALNRSSLFAQAGQRISLHCPDRPVWVRVDRNRTSVVVGNLLINALKYSVNRTDVRCHVAVDGSASRVVVEDDGIGIAAEDMPALFTRFGRIRRDPAARSIPGTGLGLYLARELARAHGGDVMVASEPGKGSAFTLSLPLAD